MEDHTPIKVGKVYQFTNFSGDFGPVLVLSMDRDKSGWWRWTVLSLKHVFETEDVRIQKSFHVAAAELTPINFD